MNVRDICLSRHVPRIGVSTPLLVPSFSSRGFSDVATIHALTRQYLFDVSLVSAFDLFHGVLLESDIYATDLLFLDSGGYEARVVVEPLEPYADTRTGCPWALESYCSVLQGLQPLAKVAIVNFDFAETQSLRTQIDQARSLFDAYPAFAADFLCKPTATGSSFIEVDELIRNADALARFDLIGITEKELGPSLLCRCQNLIRFRSALSNRGYATPIHIFGCLDPATLLAYFLCGADIFDGLTWLRFAIEKGTSIYHAAAIVSGDDWSARDEDLIMLHRVQNLDWLRQQQQVMAAFSRDYQLADLEKMGEFVPQVVSLARAAGLVFEE